MKFLSTAKNNFQFSPTFRIIGVLSTLHFAFMIIFENVTAFAPDEANYIAVFNNLYAKDFSLDGYLGWQEGSINALRIIYLPAKILDVIGFSDFYSVRILSVFYSMSSLYLLLKMAPTGKFFGRSISFWLIAAFYVPSVFVWSSLGLRESFIFVSLIAIFYLLENPQNLSLRVRFVMLATASSFLLISKVYLYGLLFICLIFSTTFLWIRKRDSQFRSIKLLSAMAIPLILFPSVSANIAASAKETLEVKLATPTPTPTPTPKPTPTPTPTVPARGQTLHDLNQQFDRNSILSWLSTVTGIQGILDEKAAASYLPAGSSELSNNTTQLQMQPASLRDPTSLLVGAYNFLFVPVPFMENGSFFLNAQSYESFAWYFYYLILVLLIIGLLRDWYSLNLVTVSSALFTLGFIILSALVEINDGTSVRHRSVLLIGILVMLATYRSEETSRQQD